MKTTKQTNNTITTKHGVKIVPLTIPSDKELKNSTSKGTRVLTHAEEMER